MKKITQRIKIIISNIREKKVCHTLLLLALCLFLGGSLRLYQIRDAGVIYQDDLRAYSGQEVISELTNSNVSFQKRISAAYLASIERTGARPTLAWFTAIPIVFGFQNIGDLYILFALCGIVTILLIWLLGKKWFDTTTAFFSALWFAVSAASVGYSRSALPVSPSTLLMVLGLFIFPYSIDEHLNFRRIAATGLCFALAFTFHPAYIFYLSVPIFLIFIAHLRNWKGKSLLKFFVQILTLVSPTILMVILYDAPRVIAGVIRGQFTSKDMAYINGLLTLSVNPAIYSGVHEGILFWLEYVKNSEGILGFIIILIALVSYAAFSRTEYTLNLVIWMSLPWMAFVMWNNVNSYGRLYAPLLPVIALMVGHGISCMVDRFSNTLTRKAFLLLFTVLIIGTGIVSTVHFLKTEGKEPSLGKYLNENNIRSVIGFQRTDIRALPGTQVFSVYTPSDIQRVLCENKIKYIVFSPASFYLIIRHREYLFSRLDLEPVFTYPNPYRAPARLMEGQTPAERKLVLEQDEFAQLGLFKIKNSTDICQEKVQ